MVELLLSIIVAAVIVDVVWIVWMVVSYIKFKSDMKEAQQRFMDELEQFKDEHWFI